MQAGRALLSTMVGGGKINCAPSVAGSHGKIKQDKNLSVFTDKIFAVRKLTHITKIQFIAHALFY